MTTSKSVLLTLFLSIGTICFSQSKIDTLLYRLNPQKFAASVADKSRKLENKLVSKSMKVLSAMQKQEEKIYRKLLSTMDSLQARLKLDEVKSKYAAIRNPAIVSKAKQYIPNLDSLKTTLKFLDANGVGGKVKDALSKAGSLQNKFQQADEIKQFIRERKEQLKSICEKLGLVKQLKKINKQVYYYAAQIKEYKEILKDPKKIEKKALELLSKTKLWKDFMKKNSLLASLFRTPGDPNDPISQANLAGLQTRLQVDNLIQQQVAAGGPNAQQQFQQNLLAGQEQLSQLKDKIVKFGGRSSEDIMPEGFKKNEQKTKSFLKRLEYGANIQSQKANNFFPTTSDIGLSIGYKPNDNSVIGIGASYKMGWGRGWNNIRISNQGLGLRSYIDWKLKGSLWISGGYEQNYKNEFRSIDQLKDYTAWQNSGLIGVSKIISMKSKLFKKTKIQVLWDFLSYRAVPVGQPLIFRVGYNFN